MNYIITESQEQFLLNKMLNEDSTYNDKVLIVKKELDNNFIIQGGMFIQLTPDKRPVRRMDKKGVFYKIQSKFRDILPENERDEFLERVIDKWSENKVTDRGTLLP